MNKDNGKKNNLLTYILYGDTDPEVYKEATIEAEANNFKVLKLMSAVVGIIFIVSTVYSFVVTFSIKGRTLLCFFTSISAYIIWRSIKDINPDNPGEIESLYWLKYLAVDIILVVMLLLGTVYSRDNPATSFIVVAAVYSVLFYDMPKKTLLHLSVSVLLFVLLSFLCKPFNIFVLDALNSLSMLAIMTFLCPYITRQRYSTLDDMYRTEKERDRDALTGFLHKDVVRQIVDEDLSLSSFHDCALMFLDVDNFKHFNDTYGHETGDKLLVYIADAIQAGCPDVCTIGRFGGDEFVVFFPDIDSVNDVADTAAKISSLLADNSRCYSATGMNDCPTLSIGIALYPGAGHTYQELLVAADKMLYEVKNHGKNNVRVAGYNGGRFADISKSKY